MDIFRCLVDGAESMHMVSTEHVAVLQSTLCARNKLRIHIHTHTHARTRTYAHAHAHMDTVRESRIKEWVKEESECVAHTTQCVRVSVCVCVCVHLPACVQRPTQSKKFAH